MGKKSNKAKIRIIKTRINEIINNSKSKGESYDSPIFIPEMKQYLHDNGVSKEEYNRWVSLLHYED